MFYFFNFFLLFFFFWPKCNCGAHPKNLSQSLIHVIIFHIAEKRNHPFNSSLEELWEEIWEENGKEGFIYFLYHLFDFSAKIEFKYTISQVIVERKSIDFFFGGGWPKSSFGSIFYRKTSVKFLGRCERTFWPTQYIYLVSFKTRFLTFIFYRGKKYFLTIHTHGRRSIWNFPHFLTTTVNFRPLTLVNHSHLINTFGEIFSHIF